MPSVGLTAERTGRVRRSNLRAHDPTAIYGWHLLAVWGLSVSQDDGEKRAGCLLLGYAGARSCQAVVRDHRRRRVVPSSLGGDVGGVSCSGQVPAGDNPSGRGPQTGQASLYFQAGQTPSRRRMNGAAAGVLHGVSPFLRLSNRPKPSVSLDSLISEEVHFPEPSWQRQRCLRSLIPISRQGSERSRSCEDSGGVN